uniref:Nucleotid_trans domain-containing protein n=1 Tax=Panagrellus redivivus TaxID=6233 RepID=A0A7E4W5S3_PANRE
MASFYFRYAACLAVVFIIYWSYYLYLSKNVKFEVPLESPFFGEVLNCPNLSNSALIQSNGILNNRIAIVIAITDKEFALNCAPAMNMTSCYALHFGYNVVVLNLQNITLAAECPHGDKYFRRHCATAKWMEKNQDTIDYVLFIDADMGVVNPCHTIQEYFDDTADLIFYDRFYDFEIAAGSYIAKNTEFSRNLLKYWADYFYKLPNSLHGSDNGAIHQVFMEYLFETPAEKMACYHLWNISKSYDDLFRYQACTQVKYSTKNRKFCDGKLKLVRKDAIGWVRDVWLTQSKWSKRDFMLHGLKIEKMNRYSPHGGEWKWMFYRKTFDLDVCGSVPLSFMYKYNVSFVITDAEVASYLNYWINRAHDLMNVALKEVGMEPVA